VGKAGAVIVNADNITIDAQGASILTGIASDANSGSQGDAGDVTITAKNNLAIQNGGRISSNTYAVGKAGSVIVNADNITIDRQGGSTLTGILSVALSTGDAGNVTVTAKNDLTVQNDGVILGDTIAAGNAGSVVVNVGNHLTIRNGGVISSSTHETGKAGSVTVRAANVTVDDAFIFAVAAAKSSGRTGDVTVVGTNSIVLSNGGEISVNDLATVDHPEQISPGSLSVAAPRITLTNKGLITTASTGNVAASNIGVQFGSLLSLIDSTISTSAQDGNGGSIEVSGSGGAASLRNSQITASVLGQKGNGGDITINAGALAMDSGFIQANTAAHNGTGGIVTINAPLLTNGNLPPLNADQPLQFTPGLNVIQAAAPDGVKGQIQLNAPALDVSAGLTGLNAQAIDTGGLARTRCQASGGSSLAQTGRGGLPPSADDLSRVETNRHEDETDRATRKTASTVLQQQPASTFGCAE
jgi:large exoprotein involved in heme utilization and adhesion